MTRVRVRPDREEGLGVRIYLVDGDGREVQVPGVHRFSWSADRGRAMSLDFSVSLDDDEVDWTTFIVPGEKP